MNITCKWPYYMLMIYTYAIKQVAILHLDALPPTYQERLGANVSHSLLINRKSLDLGPNHLFKFKVKVKFMSSVHVKAL